MAAKELGLHFTEYLARGQSADLTIEKALRRIRLVGEEAADARAGIYSKVKEFIEDLRAKIEAPQSPNQVAAACRRVLRPLKKKEPGDGK